MSGLESVESRIGYQFTDRALLKRALTHRSRGGRNNERLEFLGDSILGFIVAEALYHRFPRYAEGELTRMRSRLVRRETLAGLAREIDLSAALLLGSGELKSGGHNRESILADAFEAVVGAIYLDSGLQAARETVLAMYRPLLETISPEDTKDAKTRLQESMQRHDLPLPVYTVIEQSGKAHALVFTVSCQVDMLAEPVVAKGTSRRAAEQRSAQMALDKLATDD